MTKLSSGNGKYILSYGGGVDSTALLLLIMDKKMPLDCVVFADTGNELPETYKYVNMIESLLQNNNIPFKRVMNRKGESLFDRCFRRRVIPSQIWRFCTRDFKITPIHKFYKSFKTHIYEYMGIDYDEVRRMKDSKDDFITKLYPLIDNKITRNGCIEIIKNNNLPIPVKSGCPFCPFNDDERWNYIKENHPELYQQALDLERNNKHYPKQKLIMLHDSDSLCDGVCMT